jgi:ABC-type hemin transport system ATPase subunit
LAGHRETVVLEDVDLALAPGQTAGILGRNGAGRTTLRADGLTGACLNDILGPGRARLELRPRIL